MNAKTKPQKNPNITDLKKNVPTYLFSFAKTEWDFINVWTPIGLFC